MMQLAWTAMSSNRLGQEREDLEVLDSILSGILSGAALVEKAALALVNKGLEISTICSKNSNSSSQ